MFVHGTILFHREFSTWQRLVVWISGERSSYGTISSISSSARDGDSGCGSRLQRLAARLDDVEIVPDVHTAHHANTPHARDRRGRATKQVRGSSVRCRPNERDGDDGEVLAALIAALLNNSPRVVLLRREGGGYTTRRDATTRQFHATLPTTTARRRSDATLRATQHATPPHLRRRATARSIWISIEVHHEGSISIDPS